MKHEFDYDSPYTAHWKDKFGNCHGEYGETVVCKNCKLYAEYPANDFNNKKHFHQQDPKYFIYDSDNEIYSFSYEEMIKCETCEDVDIIRKAHKKNKSEKIMQDVLE